jgi:hypothetical protein
MLKSKKVFDGGFTAAYCQALAKECRKVGVKSASAEVRQHWLEAERTWLSLAHLIRNRKEGPGQPATKSSARLIKADRPGKPATDPRQINQRLIV